MICYLCVRYGPVTIGARDPEVEEPVWGVKSVLFEFEVDEVVEPKALLLGDLRILISRHRSPKRTADFICASEAFVRQNAKLN